MMRRKSALLVAAVFLLPLMSACEGPEGPVGPQGPAGATGDQGPAGPVGPAGQDANENCTQCHADNVNLFAKQVQYAQSTHRLGGNFERSTTSCAPCHTHQGFLERIATGATSTAEDILDPAPINCRTCHQIHTTYTSADYALTVSGENDLIFNPAQGPVDFGTVGNLCSQCHQGRALSPMPVPGGAAVTLTNTRYGYHHGPQAQILGGVGAFDLSDDGSVDGGPAAHGNPAANARTCGTCHMGQAYGEQAGGHTWKMTYDYHGSERENVAGCKACHTTATTFDLGGVQTEVAGLLEDLAVELRRVGVMQPTSHYAVAGTFPADVVAAFVNHQMIEEDRSLGVHNPDYVVGILTEAIAKMQTY